MPSPVEISRTRANKTDEEFVLFLQGIPAHCRWQELKDLVRQTALQIRQAVVYDDHHGFPTGLGQIIVKHEEAAWRTYHKLSTSGWEGQTLVVTLARTCSPTRPIAGPTKSPSCMIAGYATGYSTPPTSPELPSPSYSSEYGMSPMAMHHHHHPHSFVPVYLDPFPHQSIPGSPAIHHSFCESHTIPLLPTYSVLSQTAPFNTRHPPTGPRKPTPNTNRTHPNDTPQTRSSIFIQNLPATTSPADLKNHLHPAGTITQCEVFSDRETGLCRGFARVTFHTSEEARRAVVMGNNSLLRGTRIRVRFDRYPWLGRYDKGWGGNGTAPAAPATAPTDPPACAAPAPVSVSGTRRCNTVDKCLQQPLVVNGSGSGPGKRVEATAE